MGTQAAITTVRPIQPKVVVKTASKQVQQSLHLDANQDGRADAEAGHADQLADPLIHPAAGAVEQLKAEQQGAEAQDDGQQRLAEQPDGADAGQQELDAAVGELGAQVVDQGGNGEARLLGDDGRGHGVGGEGHLVKLLCNGGGAARLDARGGHDSAADRLRDFVE